LAKLDKKVPQKKVVVSKKPLLDDTFQELESLQKKQIPKKNIKAYLRHYYSALMEANPGLFSGRKQAREERH